jgi:hypothetical protein
LQSDEVTIARLEVEVNDLKNVADHVMDMMESQVRSLRRSPSQPLPDF